MRRITWISVLLAAVVGAPAFAASEPSAVTAITLYNGPDREQRLAEGARREGELMLYTSFTVQDMEAINAAFEKKYGVKVKMWRAGASKVAQRALTEAQGNRFDVDVIEANTVALESLHREKVLAPVHSPHHASLIPRAVPAHKEWVGSRLNVFVHAYHTNSVKKDELPKTYADLLDPKWKGRLGIEEGDYDWFSGVIDNLGEEKGLQLFRDIVANNGISVRKGHTLLTNLAASGEVPLALTVYDFTAQQLKEKGAPLDWFVMEPVVARANGLAVAARAPHPHAAALFYDFMISEEGQQILKSRNVTPTSAVINKTAMILVDPARMIDEKTKWNGLYDEIIVRQSR
jgi:iron(III) transport system substrate-binding protein